MDNYCKECKRFHGDTVPHSSKPSHGPAPFRDLDMFSKMGPSIGKSPIDRTASYPDCATPTRPYSPPQRRRRIFFDYSPGGKVLFVLVTTFAFMLGWGLFFWFLATFVWPWAKENFVLAFICAAVFLSCVFGR